MRSYSNFLLFEDILEYLPGSAPGITKAASILLNPTVAIVEEDCGTILGKIDPLTFKSQGLIELATGEALIRTRISHLLSLGQYTINIRDSGSCTSKGGICRACFNSNVLDRNTPVRVGDRVSMTNQYAYYNDIISGPGNTFSLSKTPDLYNKVLLLQNNALLPDDTYSISGNTLTLEVPLSAEESLSAFYLKFSDNLLLNYLAKSYSGSLVGLLPLLDYSLPLAPTLYQSLLSDSLLALMKVEISGYPNIPLNMVDYIDLIQDRFEKALYIILLYAIYDGGSSDRLIPTYNLTTRIPINISGSNMTLFWTLGSSGTAIAGASPGGSTFEISYSITPGYLTIPLSIAGTFLSEVFSISPGIPSIPALLSGNSFSEVFLINPGTPTVPALLSGESLSETLLVSSSGVATSI